MKKTIIYTGVMIIGAIGLWFTPIHPAVGDELPLRDSFTASCIEGYVMEDGHCVLVDLPTPEPVVEAPVVQEDDPAWDCRVMGNRSCGVEIEGTWYVVEFDEAGEPMSVRLR